MILELILEAMAELVLQLVLRPVLIVLCWFLWWLVLLPVVYLACAPFILLRAIFYAPDFWNAALGMFRSVRHYWCANTWYERWL